MALATIELFWLGMLLKDLHIPLPTPTTIWCDNIGVIALVSNTVFHAWTKHIEVDFHFIREKVTNKDIQVCYISTLHQIADIFTEGHMAMRFCILRDKLMVSTPISLREGVREVQVDSRPSDSVIDKDIHEDEDN